MTVSLLALALMVTPSLFGAQSTHNANPPSSEAAKRKAKPSKVIPGVKASKTAARRKAPKTQALAQKAPIAKEAKLNKAARATPATPVLPQDLGPIQRVEAGDSTSTGTEALVSEPHSPLALWHALVAAALLAAAAILWPRGRQAQSRWERVELIDPVFNLDLSDVTTLHPSTHVQRGDIPRLNVHERWRFVREPDADAWRLAAVEPA